jgi:hypothetical protein
VRLAAMKSSADRRYALTTVMAKMVSRLLYPRSYLSCFKKYGARQKEEKE